MRSQGTAFLSRGEVEGFALGLQMNIAEAAKVDLMHGRTDNVQVALTLMAEHDHVFMAIQDHQMAVPLGKEWADAYVAWCVGCRWRAQQQKK